MVQLLRNNLIATTTLSWVAGYIDTAGFLGLNGLFTAHVTGNLIVAGAEIAGAGGEAVWVRLAVIPVFMAAVVLTTVIARTKQPKLSKLLWLEAVTLLIFAVVSVGVTANTNIRTDTVAMFTAGATGVFAMGVRNALMRDLLGSLTPTTMMTGNLTQFTIDVARLMLIRDYNSSDNPVVQRQEIQQRITKFGSTLIGFIFGAASGAFMMRVLNFWSILLPTLAIAILAIDTGRFEMSKLPSHELNQ